jgi:hypothetical protein
MFAFLRPSGASFLPNASFSYDIEPQSEAFKREMMDLFQRNATLV